MKQRLKGALEFAQHESAAGVLLLLAAVLALVLANSPLAHLYDALLHTPVSVRIGALVLDKPLLLWINDGLMAVFFLLVGLEIKRELVIGELSSRSQAILPGIAATGGMLVPALIYVAFNRGNADALEGWAIPSATDIAFAVGVLTLVGPRVPSSLKVFLLAVAIIDDLGAIVIIALFYTSKLSVPALALAAVGLLALLAMNRRGVTRISAYVLVGVFLWVCVLKSGVHATLAGVATALAIPLSGRGHEQSGPLEILEHSLHPWVTYLILPAFAFANAGVSLAGVTLAHVLAPIPLGIAAGLFVGKQVGVFGFTWATIASGLARRPEGATWLQIYGVAILCGIGFTMSLFIGMLAFPEPAYAADIRIGVLTGSLLSALAGYAVLRWPAARSPAPAVAVHSKEGATR